MAYFFRPAASRLLFLLLMLLDVLALIGVFRVPSHKPVFYFLLPFLFGFFAYHFCYVSGYLKNNVLQFGKFPNGNWFVNTSGSGILSASISGDSVITRYVKILYFKTPKRTKPFSLLLFPDSLSTAYSRRLQVLLKFNDKEK